MKQIFLLTLFTFVSSYSYAVGTQCRVSVIYSDGSCSNCQSVSETVVVNNESKQATIDLFSLGQVVPAVVELSVMNEQHPHGTDMAHVSLIIKSVIDNSYAMTSRIYAFAAEPIFMNLMTDQVTSATVACEPVE